MRSLFLVRHLLVLLLAAALLAGMPLAAQPALAGPEILVDPASWVATRHTWDHRSRVAAATDSGGRVMVVWIADFTWPPLRGRVYEASGKPAGPAFPLDTGAQTVVDATLSPAASEGFLLAWQTSEPAGNSQTRFRLLVRPLSPAGQPLGDMVQIRGLVAYGQYSPMESVQIASAPDGSFVAVWSDTSRGDVFIRRFDAAGRPLSKAAPLPGKRRNEQRSTPSLVVLDSGEIRIAWRSSSGDGPSSHWVRRFDRNGAPLAASVRLPPESFSVTFGPDGGFLTTWWSGERLHFRAYSPDGTAFSEQQAAMFSWDQVMAERGGTFLISGTDTRGFPRCAVAGLHIEAYGNPRGPMGCLTNPSKSEVHGLSVTGTADGGFALFWSERGRTGEQDDSPRLFGQRLASVTASPGTLEIERAHATVLESSPGPLELRILRRDGTAGALSVDYRLTGAASGSGTVTFPDGDSTPRTVSIPVFDDAIPGNDRIARVALSRPTGGAVLGSPRRAVIEIRDDDASSPLLARAEPSISLAYAGGGQSSLEDPDLAAIPGGGFVAAWGHSEGDFIFDHALEGVRFDAAAFPTAVFEIPCDQQPFRVRLAMHPAGDFMVFWHSWDGYYSFSQRFDAFGAVAGPAVSMGFPVDDAAPLPKGRFVAVGSGHDTAGEGLFAHFLSTRGLDRVAPVPLTREELQPGSPAVVATDGTGRSVVVWSVAPTGAGPAGIFARRFNALGAPLGPVFRVSQGEGHDLMPSVATNVHGDFVVAWQRSWDGDGTGVYARVFDPAGAPLSDEIPVNSDTEGDQGAPSVALTGDGRFAVFWQSASEVFFGVAGQLFARDGTRLGSEAQVDPNEGRRPTAVWSDRGYFVTIACYYRENYYSGDLCVRIAARRLPL